MIYSYILEMNKRQVDSICSIQVMHGAYEKTVSRGATDLMVSSNRSNNIVSMSHEYARASLKCATNAYVYIERERDTLPWSVRMAPQKRNWQALKL